MENELSQKAEKIAPELGIKVFKLQFVSFSNKARDPQLHAVGYNPQYRARAVWAEDQIEINLDRLQDNDLGIWKSWDDILAHEFGHLILRCPPIDGYFKDSVAGRAMADYIFGIQNMPQDLTIAHIMPEKYTDLDLSKIRPFNAYQEAAKKVNVTSTLWGFQLGIVVNLPEWLGYAFCDKGKGGKPILKELEKIIKLQPSIRPMFELTGKLLRPFSEGKDCRTANIQDLVDQAYNSFRGWVESRGKDL